MNVSFEDFYGQGRLVAEDKSFMVVPPTGVLVKYKGVVGKLYAISDKSSHCGGHGMGDMKSCQAVIATSDMNLVPVKSVWNGPFEIELVE